MIENKTASISSKPEEQYHSENKRSMQPGETSMHEKELAENARFIQQIIDTSPVLILVTDILSGKLIYINKTTEEVFGYSRTQVPAFNREDYVHPQDKEAWSNLYKQASELRDDAVCEGEYRIKDTHGDYVWLHNRSTVFKRDEHGKAWQILSICTDVTAHKLAEERLIESVQFNQHISDAIPDILCVYDLRDNKVTYLNRMPYELLGYTNEDIAALSGEKFISIIHPDDYSKFSDFLSSFSTASDSDVKILEHRIKGKGGEWHYFKVKGKVFKRDDKGVPTQFVAVVQDVTEQVNLNLQVFEKNTFIETLVDANIDRIMAYDKNINVVAWNKRCEEVYGIKKGEILGKPFFSFFPKLKDTPAIADAFNRSMNGEVVHIPVHKNIYSKEYSEIFYTPLKDAANNVTGVVTIIHDLTERIQAENQLMQLNASLQAKNKELETLNEELTTFAFIASHDLGEPLRKIQIFTDRILKTEQQNLSTAGKDSFERVLGGVRRMNALLNDVLSFSRISSSKEAFEKCELNQVLLTVKKEMADMFEQTGAIIESDSLPAIMGIKSHLILLFQNLLSNAIKYQKRGNKPVIQIQHELFGAGIINHPNADVRKAYHQISFEDNGIGFEPQYAEKIFQMFQRLHGASEFPGTGIGLAICKKIIEAHNGFIMAESTPGAGSVFHCYFPVDGD